MITHVKAIRLMDQRLIRAVERAEEANGFRIGNRFSSQDRHLVQVLLVPRRHWWMCDLYDEGRLCNCRFMTAEDHARTSMRPRH